MSDDFDEDLYLAVNDDVRMAVANGGFKSGYEHWLMYGKQEEALGYRKSHINTVMKNIIKVSCIIFKIDQVIC